MSIATMKQIELKQIDHNFQIGDHCINLEPNIRGDCLLYENGQLVGFFMNKLPKETAQYADIANAELLSANVPKSEMRRSSGLRNDAAEVRQYSTIIGACPPKPHMRRPYPTISSVHAEPKAQNFIKAMLLLCAGCEKLIKRYMPEQYEKQKELISQVPQHWRFGELFTSSISNFNIPAAYHIDRANIRDTVNVIITKRYRAEGGDIHVPDYNACFKQVDNSILVYPAWRNMHGVTPIKAKPGGHRNSLVFYPLKAFVGCST